MYKVGSKVEIACQDPDYKQEKLIKRTGIIIGITDTLVIMEFKYKKGNNKYTESFLLRDFSDIVK